jgi:7-keto-8-aminopelargonate synthetase-like enzyme
MSPEYETLIERLRANCRLLTQGARALGLTVLGGETPIISILVGDEGETLCAGNFLFARGYYVQSVTFPAVPYHGGVLRLQINANHRPESVRGLVEAFAALQKKIALPAPGTIQQAA